MGKTRHVDNLTVPNSAFGAEFAIMVPTHLFSKPTEKLQNIHWRGHLSNAGLNYKWNQQSER